MNCDRSTKTSETQGPQIHRKWTGTMSTHIPDGFSGHSRGGADFSKKCRFFFEKQTGYTLLKFSKIDEKSGKVPHRKSIDLKLFLRVYRRTSNRFLVISGPPSAYSS